ncbi:DNA polymerase III subunit alpha, partial [bacterium]|nr:DNA polymerase III subunit alpha [bacterium]
YNRVHFLKPEDYPLHRLLCAIRTRKTVETLTHDDHLPPSCHFATQAEMERLFHDMPDALAATHEIANRCDVTLPIGQKQLPRFQPEDGTSPEAFLRQLCEKSIHRLYSPAMHAAARARMDHELDVIGDMGYAAYFLVVWDIVRFARQNEIPSTGRGSAADSLISYLLGFTHVDPIKHNLYFERFLNPHRTTPPDIDIDLCWRRRDRVVEYVYDRWGHDKVAMISTHVTLAGRASMREVGKALGLSESELGKYTTFMPHHGPINFEQIKRERPESRHLDFNAEPLRTLIPLAQRLEGFPSHLSVHPSGIVVSPVPLTKWVPLEIAAKGLVVTQYDMYPIEDLGLMKIDLLGQRSLSVIADVRDQVRQTKDPDFSFDHINPEADEPTRDLIEAGRTIGVFQIESPSMRGVLKKVHARDFETVTAASSVIRPGPKDSGMLRAWIRRHLGKEPAKYLHPRLKSVLSETHGILIYQEDVLKVAQAIAGFSLARADMMRRSMSDKRPEQSFSDLENDFLEGARQTGVNPSAARAIWQQMQAFAGYAFCKAHSASYTVLAFQSAWLKTHYPAEFMAAVLANGGGFYDRGAYVSEARRLGLEVLLPSLNQSCRKWYGHNRFIRCGLEQLKGFREHAIDTVLAERETNGPFRNLQNAFERLPDVEKSEWDNLIQCGACDDFLKEDQPSSRTRPQLLWSLDARFRKGNRKNTASCQLDLLTPTPPQSPSEDDVPNLPEFPTEKRFDDEARILEVCIRSHPLERFRALLPDPKQAHIIPARDMPLHAGRQARLVGWLVTGRRLRTSRKNYMKFLTLEDETDIYEAILFDKAYQRYGHLTLTRGPYLLEGRIENEEGHCSVHINRLELLRP